VRIYAEQTLVAAVADDGPPSLTYAQAWRDDRSAYPVSLSMPLAKETWPPETLLPWLMNLLPEGEPLRAMTRALGVAQEDILGLLAETGQDLAGALRLGRPRPEAEAGFTPIPDPAALERIIEELPARPFLAGEEGVSMSLAGAQDKLPLLLRGDQLGVPTGGAASTHILKPDNPRLPGSVQNEALCMVLARLCGLETASVTTGLAGQRHYLLVSRFDRYAADHRLLRLHQEDFCQALGLPPGAKYQHNGLGVPGPSLPDMFALAREHMTARDITRLLDAVIFNIAIGNVDSHAKNYSILLRPGGPELAPLYDLMTGLGWTNITQNHAQDIDNQRRGRHIYGRHWRRMAEQCGLAPPAAARRVKAICDRVLRYLPAAAAAVAKMPAGGERLDLFVTAIAERARLVGEHAQIDGPDEAAAAPEAVDGASTYAQ
jgi:serine/threonine-protein kinase HipA